MGKPVKYLRRIAAILVGVPLFIVGLILIPLPGPGILVSFLALLILSSEFDALKPYRDKAHNELKKIYAKAKQRQDNINNKYK